MPTATHPTQVATKFDASHPNHLYPEDEVGYPEGLPGTTAQQTSATQHEPHPHCACRMRHMQGVCWATTTKSGAGKSTGVHAAITPLR